MDAIDPSPHREQVITMIALHPSLTTCEDSTLPSPPPPSEGGYPQHPQATNQASRAKGKPCLNSQLPKALQPLTATLPLTVKRSALSACSEGDVTKTVLPFWRVRNSAFYFSYGVESSFFNVMRIKFIEYIH